MCDHWLPLYYVIKLQFLQLVFSEHFQGPLLPDLRVTAPELYEIWAEHRPIINALLVRFIFPICCSRALTRKLRRISHFCAEPVKIKGETGETFVAVFRPGLSSATNAYCRFSLLVSKLERPKGDWGLKSMLNFRLFDPWKNYGRVCEMSELIFRGALRIQLLIYLWYTVDGAIRVC